MAQANRESDENRTIATSGDFSLVQAGSGDSILRDTSWPLNDENSYASSQSNRSTAAEETVESNQIYASHYALATAYARVTKKLAEAEHRNQQLIMQDSLRGQDSFRSGKMSGVAGSQTNYAMAPDLSVSASVNQAWEAYNEKCKECQQLREELEELKQRNNNAEHHSRLKNLQEDVLREKAKQDDVVRRLEKTKMEADHLEKKEILAREELEKEREYQRSLIQSAEKKHREMEQRIEELERNLSNEKSLTEDLRKRERNRQKVLEDEFNLKKETFLGRIKELEEKNIQLKEEVSVLVSMQSSGFNGSPAAASQMNGIIDGPQIPESEKDAAALELDIQSLKRELADLKSRATEQCSILSTLLQNPKVTSLLSSTDFQNNISENISIVPTKKCNSSETVHKRKKTSSPKSRNLAANIYADGNNVSSTSSSFQDIYGTTSANPGQTPHTRHIPPKYPEDALSSAPVMKHAEDIIRAISKEGSLQPRKASKSPFIRNDLLYQPMDVSRVIHTPESSGPRTMPPKRQNSAENFSDEFVPISTQSVQLPLLPLGSQHYNGNTAAASVGPIVNGQTPISNMQHSLPPMEIDSNQFYTTMSPNSVSSTDTLTMSPTEKMPSVRPTNPFYNDLTSGRTSLPTSKNQEPSETVQNSNREYKQAITSRNVVDLDEDTSPTSRSPQAASNYETPGNRYVPSSDEESEPGSFQKTPQQETGHQPREFVVPKVVRTGDLVAQATSSRKAFQDSGYSAPQVEAQARPAIRARPESPSQPNVRANPSEEGGNLAASPHRYPGRTKKNPAECQRCPICNTLFSADWTEDRMSRHINAHFSDDEMFSFD